MVSFMAPRSLSTWMQCLGRAGWSGSLAISVLLVKPYVFQRKKTKPEEQDSMNKKKHVHNKLVPIKQEDVKGGVDSKDEALHYNDPMQDEDLPSKSTMQLHNVDL